MATLSLPSYARSFGVPPCRHLLGFSTRCEKSTPLPLLAAACGKPAPASRRTQTGEEPFFV